MTETLDDIINEIADQIGVYGSHGEPSDNCECRVCFTVELRRRIDKAVRIDAVLDLERRVANLEAGR